MKKIVLIDLLKKITNKKNNYKYLPMLNGYTPIFSQFGNDIYASDVVQQAIVCIVDEMKKLQLVHERAIDNDLTTANNFLQPVLDNPNPIMTQSEFIEKFMWLLLLNYNSFIFPVWEGGKVTQLWPLKPRTVTFLEDLSNEIFIKFEFNNGHETILRYSDVIHLRLNYSVNDYMGGDELGQPNHSGLLKTLQINNVLLENVAKSLEASYSVNGIFKYNTLMDDGTIENNIKELEKQINNSASGFIGLDLKGEYIPIQRNLKVIDKDTLEFIDSKILRNWGVSIAILTGDYKKEQYEAFYQKVLEPKIIQIGQSFTKVLFTEKQKSFGNRISCYPEDLIFLNTTQKLELIRLLGDSGGLYENEKRKIMGLRPLPELQGVRKQSLNYVDVDIAGKYQVGDYSQGGEGDGI